MRTYSELRIIMETNPDLFKGLSPEKEVEFHEWLPDNIIIYNAFRKYALILKRRSKRKYHSARAIWERLRWNSMLTDKPEGDFKINNNNAPFVSRLIMKAEPELGGMFNVRGKK